MGGWVDQGGHVAGCVCMVAVRCLQKMMWSCCWLCMYGDCAMAAKNDLKSGHVLAGPRNWLGDGHAWNLLPKYLAMYGHIANFIGT